MKSVSETGHSAARPSAASTRRFSGTLVAATLAVGFGGLLGLTACDRDYSFAYVYAPSASLSSGLVNGYRIDYQRGQLHLLEDSPIPSGGRSPNAIVAAPNHLALYVVNHDDSTVEQFAIGTDGKLYPQHTYNTTGSFPTSVAISADGKFLYVPYTYQNGFTTASPGPGGVTTFPVNEDNSLGTPLDFHIGRAPIAVATSGTGNFVYVVSQDAAAVGEGATQTSNLFAFQSDPTTGIAPLAGQTINAGNVPSYGYLSGQTPAGVLEDPAGAHLYLTDSTANVVISYNIAAGVPTQITNGTVPTDGGPRGMTIDPISGSRLYVANYTSGTINQYTFNNGVPVPSTTAASTQAGTGTTCVTIEPTRGIFLYASGSLSNTITGEEIVADGSLKPIIGSPYAASVLPTCAVAIPRY